MDYIRQYHPEIEVELITMKTTGDIILDQTLDMIGGKGLFVKELDRALLNNEVDITVHSFKDMPMEVDPRLPIVAVSRRENPRDVLVLPQGQTKLDFSKPIGCSSARRTIQLQKLFPQCHIAPVRGNVLTRLKKLDSGEFSALVLAYAGLRRLGLENRISRVFEPTEILPAAVQGILAVQARADFDVSFLNDFNDRDTLDIARAERSFVRALDGGCSSPVAAYAQLLNDDILLTGFYVDEATNKAYISTKQAGRAEAAALGRELAEELKQGGGKLV
jgi:hydroxymethylbilane synthase